MADFAPRVIATSDVALTGTPVIDGLQTVPGDVVLVVGQLNPAHNGLYRVPTTEPPGAWVRRADFDASSEMQPGTDFYIAQGSHRGEIWFLDVLERPTEVDVTPLVFRESRFSPRQVYRYGFFSSGLRVTSGGPNRLLISDGAMWVPGSPSVLQAPPGFEKQFGGLDRYANYYLFFFEREGRLDAELAPDFPELVEEPVRFMLKPGDPSCRALSRWPYHTDAAGNLRPFAGARW